VAVDGFMTRSNNKKYDFPRKDKKRGHEKNSRQTHFVFETGGDQCNK
jgi:hypothetical protein